MDPSHVAAVLPRLSAHLRAVVELMQLTGMRPGEVCRLRLGEVDRTGDVWAYRPALHKTRHRGKSRLVPIGPRARAVLEGFLAGRELGPDEPVFSPLQPQSSDRDADSCQPRGTSSRKKEPTCSPAAPPINPTVRGQASRRAVGERL